jgi:hypothetical protein
MARARYLQKYSPALRERRPPCGTLRNNAVETVSRTEDIEAGCDPAFEQRWWRIQRTVWVILVLLLLAGLAGVFGHGPLSEATVHPPGSQLQVHYDRLARRETPSSLRLQLDKNALASGRVCIHLNRALLDRMLLKQIVPAPLASEPLTDGASFIFRTDPTRDTATIVFIENPTMPGFVDGEVTVEGAEPVRFRQFVFP